MKHGAGILVLLVALSGCVSSNPRPNLSSGGLLVRPAPDGSGRPITLTSTPMPAAVYPGSGPLPSATARVGAPSSPYAQATPKPGLRPVYSEPTLAAQPRLSVGPVQFEEMSETAGPQEQSRSLMASRSSQPVQAASAWQTPEPPIAATAEPSPTVVPVINTRHIPFNFSVESGTNAPTKMELWYTYNGGPWQRHPKAPPSQPPYTVEVANDGIYGFCLVGYGPKGGVPPSPGETPQLLVEVDTTAPQVQLVDIKAPPQGDVTQLTIYWTAKDKNLAENGVDLLWARAPNGPWTPIITQLQNTGFYEWKLPPGLPSPCYVRVEAKDTAENVGAAETPSPVVFDGGAVPLPMRTMVESVPARVAITALEPENVLTVPTNGSQAPTEDK